MRIKFPYGINNDTSILYTYIIKLMEYLNYLYSTLTIFFLMRNLGLASCSLQICFIIDFFMYSTYINISVPLAIYLVLSSYSKSRILLFIVKYVSFNFSTIYCSFLLSFSLFSKISHRSILLVDSWIYGDSNRLLKRIYCWSKWTFLETKNSWNYTTW